MFNTPFLDIPALASAAGTVRLPGSKSISNRVLLLAALAEGTTVVRDLLDSDDTRVMLDALTALGCGITRDADGALRVEGTGGKVDVRQASLFMGNAGTAMRPLTAALALLGGDFELRGVPRMHERPIGDLVDALTAAGARIGYEARPGFPPLRIDPAVTPTMAKAPTLGMWELDLLRSIDHVVRGRIRVARRGRLDLDEGSVALADDALVVNCAADGLKNQPLVPIWGPEMITLQPVRAGFPCFGAALAGYVEATRGDDVEKNRLCRPSSYGNSLTDWARMQVRGSRNTAAFFAEPDIKEWTDRIAVNPARIPSDHPGSPGLDDAVGRLGRYVGPGVARLAELGGLPA